VAGEEREFRGDLDFVEPDEFELELLPVPEDCCFVVGVGVGVGSFVGKWGEG
jgi:hypothetical protein